MEVAFIYIEEHRSISRLSIPLTSRHNFEYKNGQLKITNNNDLIEDFYSSVNLTAIIGKNGSGKSTILDFIEAIHSYNFSSGFIIFRKKENEIYKFEILYVNHEKVSIQSELNFKEITSLKQLNYNTIKINNLSSFGNSKPIKTKNILDFTSEKLGRTKTGRIKQINYIFEYFEYLKTTRKNKKIRTPSYIFRFNGWTNPLKNNLKKHFTNHLFSNDDSLSEILHKSEELVIDEYSHLNRESQKIEFRNLKNIKTIDELPPFIRKKLDYISEGQIQIFEQIFGENLFYNIFIKFIIKSTLKVLESLNIEETDRSNIIVIFLKRIAEDRYIENINFSPEPLMDDFVNSFILAKELRESYSISSSYISSITPEIQKEAEENYSIEIEKITAFLKKAATNEWIEIKDNNSIKNDSLPTIAFPNLDLQYKDIFTFKNNSRFHFEYKGY